VVVGVEELGHVERARALRAARHRKVLVEPAQGAEARGGESEVEGPVEDLVVQGAVEPDERDAGVGLELPGSGLDVGGDLEELLLGDALLPVAGGERESFFCFWKRLKNKKRG
jgi:hypothetical protein